MDRADIPILSAVEISRAIARKDVSPVEVTEAFLERIAALNPKFNAYLTVCAEQALEAARAAEKPIVRGRPLGPLHGVPVAVKDQLWTKDVRTTGGSTILSEFVPSEDATAVAKLKSAGAILLGKTNLMEFAVAPVHRYGAPRNPWNLDRSTGGSSSGSAAATAAFLCAMALGEDTTGSIRVPAAWCGLVGLRPTPGIVSNYGVMPGVRWMDTVGPMARTVEDAALALEALAGFDSKDSLSSDRPAPNYRGSLTQGIEGVRVGVIRELLYAEPIEPEVRRAVVEALSVLTELGASVEPVSLPLVEYSGTAALALLAAEAAVNHRDWLRDRPSEYADATRLRLLMGALMPREFYGKALSVRDRLRREVAGALERCDVLVLPTSGSPATKLEGDPAGAPGTASTHRTNVLTPLFSLAGVPALSVPCGLSSEGLPIGLQIGGRAFGEETLFRVAYAYEQHTPWHTVKPPASEGGVAQRGASTQN